MRCRSLLQQVGLLSRPGHVQRDLPWHRTVHEWNPEIAHCSPAFVLTVFENPTWKQSSSFCRPQTYTHWMATVNQDWHGTIPLNSFSWYIRARVRRGELFLQSFLLHPNIANGYDFESVIDLLAVRYVEAYNPWPMFSIACTMPEFRQ